MSINTQYRSQKLIKSYNPAFRLILIFLVVSLCGCQEIDTIKRELILKAQSTILKKKSQFTPKDGMTIRTTSLYQTANPNSEIIRRLPAETPVHLIDKVGDMFRARTRDGREGYIEQRAVGGEDIIHKTQELRLSIEGLPIQAEAVTKTKANFRLSPGRHHEVVETLPPGKKLEVYERVVTLRKTSPLDKSVTRGKTGLDQNASLEDVGALDENSEDVRKDVWYKVKIEDGRVGYIYTHNMKLTPPDDIARAVPFMRMIAWRTVNSTDDPDRGIKNNFIVAYAPIGKDAGCDYTRLYFMSWSSKLKRRIITWQLRLDGILPITDYHYESKPGFSVRYLHPNKKDRLVLASFVFSKGSIRKVSEEEIPNNSELH
ncbi:MAG: hypothetical protein AB7V04_13495 [Desulfomonilaceae bacterium]